MFSSFPRLITRVSKFLETLSRNDLISFLKSEILAASIILLNYNSYKITSKPGLLRILPILIFSAAESHSQTGKEIYFQVTIQDCDLKNRPGREAGQESFADHAILKLPGSYSETGSPTRLVYMAHGAGGGVTGNEWFLNRFGLQELLLKNGYAVFDVNGGRVENMGGEFVLASAFKAYQHIVENYNVHPRIIVGGFSMGGLSSTNFVYRYSPLVLAHVMYSPVLDLYGQAWQNPWLKTTRKAIAEVYGFEDPSGNRFDSCAAAAANPLARFLVRSGDDTMKLYPVPVKIWHGTGDKVVTVDSSRLFYKYVKRGGSPAELVEIDSDDHGLSCGNEKMDRELLEYIKRFN